MNVNKLSREESKLRLSWIGRKLQWQLSQKNKKIISVTTD